MEKSDQGLIEQPEKIKRNRFVKGLVIGLGVFVVIALVTGMSAYSGAKFTRENFKEGKQMYHINDRKFVEEVSKVTETEVTIKAPNVVEMVFDYKNGVIVERFVDSESKLKSDCYARALNQTSAPTTDAERYQDQEIDLNQMPQEESRQKWVATPLMLAKHLVSENVAEMCNDTEIFWMEGVEETVKEKREVHYLELTRFLCYPHTYQCSYYCYFYHDYRTAAGIWTLFLEQVGWYCLKNCYSPECVSELTF